MSVPQEIATVDLPQLSVQLRPVIFHKVNDVLPETQKPLCVERRTSVIEAFQLMRENDYSQLPVIAGGRVFGVFSYNSFSKRLPNRRVNELENTPVGEFVEQCPYIAINENITSLIDLLNKTEAILVGSNERLTGIVTPFDLVRYLYKVSIPYILINEIEIALRQIIGLCTSPEELTSMVKRTLSSKYKDCEEKIPASIEKMTFGDYAQIIGFGDNWPKFVKAFGGGSFNRNITHANLMEIDGLRNDAFHFRRELSEKDISQLQSQRDNFEIILADLENLDGR